MRRKGMDSVPNIHGFGQEILHPQSTLEDVSAGYTLAKRKDRACMKRT